MKVKCEQIFAVKNKSELADKIKSLEIKASEPELWNNSEEARKVTQQLNTLKSTFERLKTLENALSDIDAYFEMALEQEMQGDEDGANETANEANNYLESVQEIVEELEVQTMLSGKYDKNEAVVTIRSGAGGVEAMDWTQMLLRMYMRWCESKGYETAIEDISYGDVAGISSVTFEVREPYAYGELAFEAGTHRLVRISPFNAQGKRQTSFAAVDIVPLIEETDEIEIPENELKVDVFRSSGPGGQSVNTTDSAVRLTHLPSGIVVSMQNEKSQIQNRVAALKVLKSRLLLKKQNEENAEKRALAGDNTASWGDQVRNYVFMPYQLVKDTRTGEETSQIDKVMDGEIDRFIRSGIRFRATNN